MQFSKITDLFSSNKIAALTVLTATIGMFYSNHKTLKKPSEDNIKSEQTTPILKENAPFLSPKEVIEYERKNLKPPVKFIP